MGEPVARSAIATLTPAEGAVLTRLAAAAVVWQLGGPQPALGTPGPVALRAKGASFVTLMSEGTLRGCIGTLEPVRPLYQDVIRNAARATTDPRLAPVTGDEWPKLDLSVTVLGPLERLVIAQPDELLSVLRPRIDGLIVTDGVRRATFLPAVWEKLAEPADFLAALLAKGGWEEGWPAGLRVARYCTVEFHDHAPRRPLG